MSTGLTYVTFLDNDRSQEPNVVGTFIFSSYDEAYNFGDWYCRSIQAIQGASRYLVVQVYTTGPNDSGWWNCGSTPPTWNAFD